MKYKTFMPPSATQPRLSSLLPLSSLSDPIIYNFSSGACLDPHNTLFRLTVHQSSTSSREPHVWYQQHLRTTTTSLNVYLTWAICPGLVSIINLFPFDP
ncbi:hypothetical protein E2C01_036131 [Portunus trituberculatus]|uniref:Uncharacterized protein n=1 Tax=Portunus trituberculatus TaxID=210409 RepID=A0A5B7FB78_PORTR|nr:hypothetical protein [Portunus trituberculatus]